MGYGARAKNITVASLIAECQAASEKMPDANPNKRRLALCVMAMRGLAQQAVKPRLTREMWVKAAVAVVVSFTAGAMVALLVLR